MHFFRVMSAAAAGSLLLASCSSGGEAEGNSTAATSAPRAVRTALIQDRTLARDITASGTLRPREEASIGAEQAGYRVLRVLADVGSIVARGQPLVILDPVLIEAQIAQQRANLDQQVARAAQAGTELRRVADLRGTGVVAEEQIDQRRTEAAAATANVRAARAQLQDSLTRRERLTVRAPVGGVILSRAVRPGDITAGGGTPMFTLARDRLIELQAELAEDALRDVRPGQPVRVTLADGTQVEGSVRLVSPSITAESRLGLVYIGLPVRPDIRAGGFASASLGAAGRPVLAVPEAAVVFSADGPRLTMIDRDNRAREVAVKTGARGGGWVELTQGPPTGTRVALGASSFVVDGEKVRLSR